MINPGLVSVGSVFFSEGALGKKTPCPWTTFLEYQDKWYLLICFLLTFMLWYLLSSPPVLNQKHLKHISTLFEVNCGRICCNWAKPLFSITCMSSSLPSPGSLPETFNASFIFFTFPPQCKAFFLRVNHPTPAQGSDLFPGRGFTLRWSGGSDRFSTMNIELRDSDNQKLRKKWDSIVILSKSLSDTLPDIPRWVENSDWLYISHMV